MPRVVRALVLAALFAGAVAARGAAQEAAPVRLLPTQGPAGSPPCTTIPLPLLYADRVGGAAPPACAPFEDQNGPLLIGRPELDGPHGADNLGWLGGVELDVVIPHLRNRLTAPVAVGGGRNDQLHVPGPDLGWTVSPRIELGYRWGQGAGELVGAYRLLNDSGSQAVIGGRVLRSALSLHVFDFDYANHEHSLGPLWDMKWRVGLRAANLTIGYQADGLLDAQNVSNYFWGIGPHVGLDLRRQLGISGLSLFGRFEGASPVGSVHQTFEETQGIAPTQLRKTAVGLSLNVQAGLSWNVTDRLGLTAGYTFTRWWEVGFTPDTRADLWFQGGFLRGEWKY